MLGKGGAYADQCKSDGYIGADFNINEDLTKSLPVNWRNLGKS